MKWFTKYFLDIIVPIQFNCLEIGLAWTQSFRLKYYCRSGVDMLRIQFYPSEVCFEFSRLYIRLGQADQSTITNPQNLPIRYMNQLDTKKSNI